MTRIEDNGKLVSDQRSFALIYRDFFTSSKLTPTEKLVYIGLKMHMNKETEQCFPSIGTLAMETGLSKRSVQRAMLKFEELGVLKIEHRKGPKGEHTSNLYTLYDLRRLWDDAPEEEHVTSIQQETDAINLLKSLGYEITKTEKKLAPDSAKSETSVPVKLNTSNCKGSEKSCQAKTRIDNSRNRFNNFEQRTYNFEELEAKLQAQ